MKRFLIIGFGRMGITHLSHINGMLAGECKFDVYDPSFVFKAASLFRIRENIRFLSKLPNTDAYDGVVITSPPRAHSANFDAARHLGNSFFIEKPLALGDASLQLIVSENKHVMCGYVLRHNPCALYLERLVRGDPPASVEVTVKSNLGLEGGEDWRFDLHNGGGCLNELGSHAINLALSFLPDKQNILASIAVEELSVPSFRLTAQGACNFSVYGNWSEDVRKTTYMVTVEGRDYRLKSDLQSVEGQLAGNTINWSPHQEALYVDYYMRGTDFALQAENFVQGEFTAEGLNDAVLTDKVLERALKHA